MFMGPSILQICMSHWYSETLFFLLLVFNTEDPFLRDALGSKTQTLKNKKLIQKWFKMEGHLLTCLCDCTNCSCFYRSGFISIKTLLISEKKPKNAKSKDDI